MVFTPFSLPVSMDPHGHSPWYLHETPAYAKTLASYPPAAKSAGALKPRLTTGSATIYAFIYGLKAVVFYVGG